MHYLERGFDSEVEDGGGGYDGGGGGSEDLQSHILYKHSDLITNHSCGTFPFLIYKYLFLL